MVKICPFHNSWGYHRTISCFKKTAFILSFHTNADVSSLSLFLDLWFYCNRCLLRKGCGESRKSHQFLLHYWMLGLFQLLQLLCHREIILLWSFYPFYKLVTDSCQHFCGIFRHGLHQPSTCTGWNCFYWNDTAILIPTEIQQGKKKTGTCCCAEGSADSSQPSRKAPLHSLHCPDVFKWFWFPTKSWTSRAHMHAIQANYIFQLTSPFGKVRCYLGSKRWRK